MAAYFCIKQVHWELPHLPADMLHHAAPQPPLDRSCIYINQMKTPLSIAFFDSLTLIKFSQFQKYNLKPHPLQNAYKFILKLSIKSYFIILEEFKQFFL